MLGPTAEAPGCCSPTGGRWPDAADPEVDRVPLSRNVVLIARAVLEVPVRVAVQAYKREAGHLKAIGSTHYAEAWSGESIADVVKRAESTATWGLTNDHSIGKMAHSEPRGERVQKGGTR